MSMVANLFCWVMIVLFLIDLGWKGRAIVAGLVVFSLALPYFGDDESAGLLSALGFALRVVIVCGYIIKERMPVVS